jgi:Recombination endonuclease VII
MPKGISEYHQSKMKEIRYKQFCPKNHDTEIFGRDKNGGCHKCHNLTTNKHNKKPYRRKETRERCWSDAGIKNANGTIFTYLNYDYAYQVQQGRCKFCGKHQSELKQALAADHNHMTGTFRGLLCVPCNRNKVGDHTLESSLKLVEYLRGN